MINDKLLIGGKLVAGDHRLDVINPATGKSFVTVGRASEKQLNEAVAAARAAQPGWEALGYKERARLVHAFVDGIHSEADQIARALTSEQGKPLAEAVVEVAMTESIARALADLELPSKELYDDAAFSIQSFYRPLGVVAGITPWNFPIASGLGKGASALIVGNTYIWKPAPTTPVAALHIATIAQRVLPPGVFNVIVDDNDLGSAISAHPGIDKVSFTGSTETGKKVMSNAAMLIKRVTLELGGNDAAIVLEDADVEKVAQGIFMFAFHNAGQVCIAIKRVYVHATLYDRLCSELAKLAKQVVLGDGTEQGVQMGPVQNAKQFAKAKQFLAAAHADGKVIAGGAVVERPGYFIQPTIVRDIREDSRLVQEEQFAPILPILSYQDPDDAIQRANATPFGLGGSVWSKDAQRAKQVARRINAGTVWINQHSILLPNIPYGGAKQSGLGIELGREGLEEFAQLQVVNAAKS